MSGGSLSARLMTSTTRIVDSEQGLLQLKYSDLGRLDVYTSDLDIVGIHSERGRCNILLYMQPSASFVYAWCKICLSTVFSFDTKGTTVLLMIF